MFAAFIFAFVALLLAVACGAIAKKYIDLVGLSEFVNSYPHQLSGGMQQRIAIARALSVDPEIIFMDEPFGALDTITRFKLQDDIRSIAKQNNKTIIFVTHDIEEAVYLADRIVDLVQRGVEGRRFAGAGGAGDEDDSVGKAEHAAKAPLQPP